MLLSPTLFLLIVLLATLLPLLVAQHHRRQRQRWLLVLARDWKMQYSARDVLNLAPRIAAHLPIIGAADVCARDLIYGTLPGGHRCIFCAEYTIGLVRSKSRRYCVVSIEEMHSAGHAGFTVHVADPEKTVREQYEMLKPLV